MYDLDVIEKPQYSPGPFTIKKPSTVILQDVNIHYMQWNIYILGILLNGACWHTSNVHVFVAGRSTFDSVPFYLIFHRRTLQNFGYNLFLVKSIVQ